MHITDGLVTTGTKTWKSLLIEDGTLPWIVQNANNEASPIGCHIELALCHLAQHGEFFVFYLFFILISESRQGRGPELALIYFISEINVKGMISRGALWELVGISRNSSREDIRTLAHRTRTSGPTFQAELKRLRIDCG